MAKIFRAARVVFDLDGTLVDTAPDLAAAMNHVLAGMGRPALPEASVRAMVGAGARALIERGLAATGGVPAEFDMAPALQRFLDWYSANIVRATRPFPGAEALLGELSAAGIALGLCTNKPQALTEALLEGLGLARWFGCVAGADAVSARKPDPAHLDHVLDRLGGDGPALMVGDTATDVAAARALGLPVVLVDFGYSPVPARTLGGDAVVGSLAELAAMIRPV